MNTEDNHLYQVWQTDEDEGHYSPKNRPSGPTTWSSLLEHLGVADSPESEQDRAVEDWLVDNDPAPLLKYSLTKRGILP